MKKVGLVGEDPSDTSSIKTLLEQKYKAQVQFVSILQDIQGDDLGNEKTAKLLLKELKTRKYDIVVCIRDLDALKSQNDKFQKRIDWFKKLNARIAEKGVDGLLLLNIWELEALIFGDIETLNSYYKIKHHSARDPTFISDPKKKLKRLTNKTNKPYKESDSPLIFEKLRIDEVIKNCSCFREFITEFEAKLN